VPAHFVNIKDQWGRSSLPNYFLKKMMAFEAHHVTAVILINIYWFFIQVSYFL
jgi:hypothetical protein